MLRVHEQEQRAHRASLRAEEVLHVCSYGPMREAERKAKEATHRAQELEWRVEVGGIRPRSLVGTRPARIAPRKGSVDE
jgi:hypothetical protein